MGARYFLKHFNTLLRFFEMLIGFKYVLKNKCSNDSPEKNVATS